ncbi:MAG: hypothetical protein DRI39_03815, partial [Chloroflexi bacterium]
VPDEFHDTYPGADEAGLNNNSYTNIMAVWVMRRALDTLGLPPTTGTRLSGRTWVSDERKLNPGRSQHRRCLPGSHSRA